MTEREALKALHLEGGLEITGKAVRTMEFFEGLDVAIKALEEIQQYRAIGTVEECREAVEKQKPKKSERGLGEDVRCPICGTWTTAIYEHRYCSYCGQRLG